MRHGVELLLFLTFSVHLSSADTHSLQYFHTAFIVNTPKFTALGQVDGEQIDYYDSEVRRAIPKTEWIQKVTADDPLYWDKQTHVRQGQEETFTVSVATAMQRFNQTEGVHTLQRMVGCELDDDGTIRGFYQDAFDEDFISFDLNTLTWIAPKPQAVITKHKWDAEEYNNSCLKNYLQDICIKWLKKYVTYGKERLERKDRPEVSVFYKHSPSPDVVCHATGFFPKTLSISWQKNGEDVNEDVEYRETLPNPDGSFQKRIILTVPAEELQKHTYTCVVQHSSLEKDLVVVVPKDEVIGLIGIVVVLGSLIAVVAVIVIKKNYNFGFRRVPPKPSSEEDSSSSNSK